MKKVFYMAIFLFFSLLMSVKVMADKFEPYLSCDTGFVPYDDPAVKYQVSDGVSTSSVIEFFRNKKTCFNPDEIGAIMDGFNIGRVTIWDPGMYYCPKDSVVGFDDNLGGYTNWGLGGLAGGRDFCCSSSHPYIRWGGGGGNYACCTSDRTGINVDPGRDWNKDPPSCGITSAGVNIDGEKPVKGFKDFAVLNNSARTFDNDPAYYCSENYCFLKIDASGKFAYVRRSMAGGQSKTPRSVKDKADGKCENYLIDDYGVYCIAGDDVTQEEYETYVAIGAGAVNACNEYLPDNPERTTCLNCYKNCPTKDTCSYSSLGCIQTTQSGIIVRIFQIGLGVVGALAIARFIQAALLRQTADPSKIQESYDIITSIIIGIVVLLGSTVILRFIGVDILQMLPF